MALDTGVLIPAEQEFPEDEKWRNSFKDLPHTPIIAVELLRTYREFSDEPNSLAILVYYKDSIYWDRARVDPRFIPSDMQAALTADSRKCVTGYEIGAGKGFVLSTIFDAGH